MSTTSFIRHQLLYLGIALAVYMTFWAMGQNAAVVATLIYSFCLGNLVALLQDRLFPLWSPRTSLHSWAFYLLLLLAWTPLAVAASTALVFWADGAPGTIGSYWDYLRGGWKFPFVAALIFGIVSQAYRVTKETLTRRNTELEKIVQAEDQELARAREIQQGLLPATIPQVPGMQVAGLWEPARIVGGDYFDIIRLPDNKLALCIADVVGKSVSAALLMASVQATLRAFVSDAASPSWLCGRVNSVLCANIATGKFVTLFYGVLDADCRTLRYTNAGHLPPVLVRKSGSIEQLASGGALLGVFPDWTYDESVVQLNPGDRIVLFTDGITEAGAPDGEEFGEERLAELMLSLRYKSAADLTAQILTTVKRFCTSPLHDDATLIAITVD